MSVCLNEHLKENITYTVFDSFHLNSVMFGTHARGILFYWSRTVFPKTSYFLMSQKHNKMIGSNISGSAVASLPPLQSSSHVQAAPDKQSHTLTFSQSAALTCAHFFQLQLSETALLREEWEDHVFCRLHCFCTLTQNWELLTTMAYKETHCCLTLCLQGVIHKSLTGGSRKCWLGFKSNSGGAKIPDGQGLVMVGAPQASSPSL